MKHLTDAKVRAAKIADGKYLNDTKVPGLRLELRSIKSGVGKYWVVRVSLGSKRPDISLGAYPAVSLDEARKGAEEKRAIAATGVDPRAKPKKAKAKGVPVSPAIKTFEYAAEEWIKTNEASWTRGVTDDTRGRLVRHVYDHIGHLALDDIDGPMIIDLLKRLEGPNLESSKLETRDSCLKHIKRTFRYAIAYNWTKNFPAEIPKSDVLQKRQGALAPKPFEALEWGLIQKFWHDVDNWTNQNVAVSRGLHPLTRALTKLQILTLARPSEIRLAQWTEFDLDADQPMWTVPNVRLKNRNQNPNDHLVPLSSQAVGILRELQKLTGHLKHLFPKLLGTGNVFDDTKTVSENTVCNAVVRMGYQATAHGFRHVASTYLHGLEYEDDRGEERGMFDSLWIEYALGHVDPNKVRGTYNKAKYLKPRARMLQFYADQIAPAQTQSLRLVG